MEDSTQGKAPTNALRYRDFAIYWSGLLVSGVGSQFTTVAMAWQIYELTDSALQLGLLGLTRGIPTVVLLMYGGLLADAIDRRRLLIVTQWAQLAVALGLTIATLAGAISPLILYVASALLAVGTALEQPARQAIVPNLVPRAVLTNALALNMTQRQAGMIAGPSLAGIVLGAFGPGVCYGTEAVSRLPMLAALMFVHPAHQDPGGRGQVSFLAMREGLAFLWSNPLILSLMLLDFVQGLFTDARILLPVYARDILFVGPQGLGILYASVSVGSIVTATVMSLRADVRNAGRWVLIGIVIFGLATAVFAYSQVFWLSVVMLGLTGVGNTISVILRGTILQLATPDDLRGRVSSVGGIFSLGGPQIGQFRGGLAAELMGPPLAVLSGAILLLALAATVAIRSPAVRRFQVGGVIPSPTGEARL